MNENTILIIDDDQSNISFLNEHLKDSYKIKIAYDGLNALKILDKFEIDLVLLDIEMPNMNGYEVAEKIISNDNTKDIPFIFLTANDNDESLEKGFDLGAKDFIKKPFRQKELKIRIKNILISRNQQKQLDENIKTISKIQSIMNDYLIYSETDLSGRITKASKSFCELSEYTEEELLGKNHNIVRHPDMDESVYKDLWDTIKSGKTWKGEIKNLTKNGHYYWVYASVSPKYDKNNNPVGYISLRQEITAKKDSDLQKIRLLEDSRMESLKDLLTNISHHWRQPLTTITTISSGIKIEREYGLFEIDTLDDKLDDITQNAFFLSDTINDFSSFVLDHTNSTLVKINIKDLINEAIEKIEDSLLNNNIKIEKSHTTQDDFFIHTLRDDLTDIVFKILNNAEDAIKEKLRSKDGFIKVDYHIDDSYLNISIEDNGGGLDEVNLNRVFEPYFTTKHKSSGKGLSLYKSHKIINDLLKGEISVKNTDNGALFTIKLPIS